MDGQSPVRLAVDVVVLTLPPHAEDGGPPPGPLVLAVRRDREPYAGAWSLPGGQVGAEEGLEAAVSRVLSDTARDSAARMLTRPRHLEQLGTFGDPARDPRGRVVSVTYLALQPWPVPVTGGASWQPALDPPDLAFDHARILASALDRLRAKLTYSNVAFGLLPDTFTLSELQAVYESVLDRPLDKRNFRRKLSSLGLLADAGGERRGSHRPARLYRFAASGLVLLDDVITA
jgi:8-oxo-dGTP diphosphatase